MAALSITATQVSSTSTRKRTLVCTAAITAGQSVCVSGSTVKLFEADSTAANTFDGICTGPAVAAGQDCTFVYDGDVILGTSCSIVAGGVYLGGLTAGSITAEGDSTFTGTICVIGVGKETTSGTITVSKFNSGVTGTI